MKTRLPLILPLVAGVIVLIVIAALFLGKTFQNEKNFPRLFPTLSPTPTVLIWQTYLNSLHGYEINFPPGWEKTEWNIENAAKLKTLPDGMIWQQVNLEGREGNFQVVVWGNKQKVAIPTWLRWYRHEDVDLKKIPTKSNFNVGDHEAFLTFQEASSWDYPVVRIFFQEHDKVFELIAKNPSENLDKIYLEMISSMKFYGEQKFKCPSTKTINCMPILDPKNPNFDLCQKEYRRWITQNCPGVEFAD
ncbi:hypothetical protein HY439_02595 [Candidatus Microgenomates bacterium]|nr:hypothetical protein [Candidatus Microgenomates bacterium]